MKHCKFQNLGALRGRKENTKFKMLKLIYNKKLTKHTYFQSILGHKFKIFFFLFYSPLIPVGETELQESEGGSPVSHSFIGEKWYMIGINI